MSWFRTAFEICSPDRDGYYSVLDPVEFYEWRFTDTAPKGAVFTLKLPPSDIITEGKIIVSARVPDIKLKPTKEGFALVEDAPVEVRLRIGYMPSPQELIQKYSEWNKIFSRGLESFKEDVITRLYVNSATETPHLFRLHSYTDEDVTMHNFGSVQDLIEEFAIIREALSEESMDKEGRAYELEEFRRYDNAMTFVNNSHLHVDASKMDRLLETSGVIAKQKKTARWKDCYLEASIGAKILDEKIRRFEEYSWVNALRKI